MKKRVNHTILIAVALLVLTVSSCINETTITTGGGDGDATVQLILKMPGGGGGMATRSITASPDEENRIDVVDVLAFIRSGSDWVYDYAATNVSIGVTGGGGANDMTVTAGVKAMSRMQRFVVFANSSAELAAAAPIRGEKMEDIERRIVCSTGGGEWPAKINGGSTFVPFPIYALSDAQTVDNGANNSIGTYPMIRMVARIDVTLATAINNFELKEACLFNYKTAGYISYFQSGFSTDRVTIPAVPAAGDHTGAPILTPTVHYAADNGSDARGEIKCSIYTFESDAITALADKTKKTALVIGGYYGGSSTMSYYRIDLKTATDLSSDVSGGILRNHLYKVEVQSVASEGYLTDEDAYMGDSRLKVEVTPWNLAKQNIIVDGQFYLNIEPDGDGVFHKLIPDSILTVKAETNYNITSQGFPAGIWIDASQIEYTPAVTPGSEWITHTDNLGANGSTTREFSLTINKTLAPSGGKAKVPVKAGNLTQILDVTLVSGT